MLAAILTSYWRRSSLTTRYYRFLLFFLPLFAVTALSLTYTWSTFNTLNEVNIMIWALGGAFLFSVTPNREDLLKGLVIGASLSALCAVWQLLVLFPALLDIYKEGGYAAMLRDQHVPFSSFLNQNMLGGYCAAILPISLYFALVRKHKFYFVAACLIVVGLLLSLSRLAVLASIPSAAVIAVLAFKERGVKGIMPLAACFGVGIIFVSFMIYGPHRTANDGIRSTLDAKIQRSYSEASTLNLRTNIWKTGIEALKQSPLLGYGAGSFVYPYQKFYGGKQYTRVAHGTLVKMAVELGIIGLLCFLWYCVGVAKHFKEFRTDHQALFVGLSVLVIFLFGLFDFSFDTAAHVVTFFCLSSVCFAPLASEPRWSRERLLPILFVIPLLTSFVYTAKADSSRRFVEDARMLRDSGPTEQVHRLLIEAVDSMPWNTEASVHLISSLTSSYMQEADLSKKEGLKKRLLAYTSGREMTKDKDAELFYVLGFAKGALGNQADSCQYMNRALHYNPSSACYALSAAACYAGNGRLEQALSIIRSMEAYYGNYRRWHYPDGLLVHRIKDLEAEIEYVKGDPEQALLLTQRNLQSVRQNEFVIADWRARQSVSKSVLISQLEQRVRSLETVIAQKGTKTERFVVH